MCQLHWPPEVPGSGGKRGAWMPGVVSLGPRLSAALTFPESRQPWGMRNKFPSVEQRLG